MFRALVAKGADVQAKDAIGSTTLMWAAFNEKGDPMLVEELLILYKPRLATHALDLTIDYSEKSGQLEIVCESDGAHANYYRRRPRP